MQILAVGDSYMSTDYFRAACAALERSHSVRYLDADEDSPYLPETPSECKLTEYLGSPRSLAAQLDGTEVLLVQGQAITAELLDAGPRLRLLGCARGGTVNVDTDAVHERGIPLVNTPGKNAEAVADLTLAFLVMLARGVPTATRFLQDGHQVRDNWEGARFMGADLRGHVLGLIGYGQVGQRVAVRARAFGMEVVVYDPYVEPHDAVVAATLEELLARADFVSIHARATSENAGLIDAAALAAMRPGAILVNTARESLVDEDALDAALACGHLGGAALDVFDSYPPGERSPLARHPNVVLTPHIGGATRETLRQGAEMLAEEVERFAAEEPLRHLIRPTRVTT